MWNDFQFFFGKCDKVAVAFYVQPTKDDKKEIDSRKMKIKCNEHKKSTGRHQTL